MSFFNDLDILNKIRRVAINVAYLDISIKDSFMLIEIKVDKREIQKNSNKL